MLKNAYLKRIHQAEQDWHGSILSGVVIDDGVYEMDEPHRAIPAIAVSPSTNNPRQPDGDVILREHDTDGHGTIAWHRAGEPCEHASVAARLASVAAEQVIIENREQVQKTAAAKDIAKKAISAVVGEAVTAESSWVKLKKV